MTNRETLLALADRVESMIGPDRAVDAEMMFDLYAKPVGVSKIDGGPRAYLWPDDHPSWNFGIRFPGRDRKWFDKQRRREDGERLLIERDCALVLMNDLRVPLLTASLDAAMMIMPDTMSPWDVRGLVDRAMFEAIQDGDIAADFVKKLPRFICAAALRARGWHE